MPILTWASFQMQADKQGEALALIDAVREQAASEQPGTLIYLVQRRVDDPTVLEFYECYEDDAAVSAHLNSSSWLAVQAQWTECFVGPPKTGVSWHGMTSEGGFARPGAIPLIPPP